MVNSMKSRPNSEHLRDAATLLLKGGTLINEPCPSCSGLQVKFQAENICVAGCQPQGSTSAQAQASGTSNLTIGTVKEMIDSTVKEKLVEIVQLLKQENDLSQQKIKAELIEIYLRIIRNLGGDTDIRTEELKKSL
jgi:uncharacterized Zn finger protein (UPF0148 family)